MSQKIYLNLMQFVSARQSQNGNMKEDWKAFKRQKDSCMRAKWNLKAKQSVDVRCNVATLWSHWCFRDVVIMLLVFRGVQVTKPKHVSTICKLKTELQITKHKNERKKNGKNERNQIKTMIENWIERIRSIERCATQAPKVKSGFEFGYRKMEWAFCDRFCLLKYFHIYLAEPFRL